LVLENRGVAVSQASAFSHHQLEAKLTVCDSMAAVENALARGGTDEQGADVAIMALPNFVASYEALKALDPVTFLIVGWSSGREVLLSKHGSLAELPDQGPLRVRAAAGSPEMFLLAFVFDSVGIALDRISFETAAAEKQDPDAWALPRQELAQAESYPGSVLLSSAEALGLIPYVAVAQRSFVQQRTRALVALSKVWFAGQARLTQDPTSAARQLAKLDKGPEPLALLGQLGGIAPSSVTDNALAAGVAGRGAVNLVSLFERAWKYFRQLKVLTTPPPVHTPVNGDVIAQLVLAGPGLEASPARPPTAQASPGQRTSTAVGEAPLLLLDAGVAKRDTEAIVHEVGFIAGVFARSKLRLSVYSQGVYSDKKTREHAQQATERFGLEGGRLIAQQIAPMSRSGYLLEVMPVH
jgi:ABC-type nitrate/sulfonate/bicarbonate transport system substrate-binding protein